MIMNNNSSKIGVLVAAIAMASSLSCIPTVSDMVGIETEFLLDDELLGLWKLLEPKDETSNDERILVEVVDNKRKLYKVTCTAIAGKSIASQENSAKIAKIGDCTILNLWKVKDYIFILRMNKITSMKKNTKVHKMIEIQILDDELMKKLIKTTFFKKPYEDFARATASQIRDYIIKYNKSHKIWKTIRVYEFVDSARI